MPAASRIDPPCPRSGYHGAMMDDDEYDGPSKSERKRQSTGLQELGEELIGLPETELEALPLPEILRDAVMLARRITAHGGLYRQKQYIGKLMRKIDAEPIRAAIAAKRDGERVAALRFRRIEIWRDRLIQDGPDAIAVLRAETNVVPDAAVLGSLIHRARREKDRGETPAASRELFKVLRETFAAAEKPAD
jgi:ribosome-associated protein